jgi:hypothetical protein
MLHGSKRGKMGRQEVSKKMDVLPFLQRYSFQKNIEEKKNFPNPGCCNGK